MKASQGSSFQKATQIAGEVKGWRCFKGGRCSLTKR